MGLLYNIHVLIYPKWSNKTLVELINFIGHCYWKRMNSIDTIPSFWSGDHQYCEKKNFVCHKFIDHTVSKDSTRITNYDINVSLKESSNNFMS
jgi:lysozyme family protein